MMYDDTVVKRLVMVKIDIDINYFICNIEGN